MATNKRVALLAGDRLTGESDRAVVACNDYLRMGPGRSLRKLLVSYSKSKRKQAPTEAEGTLFGWSADYDWPGRASAYDADLEDAKTERRRKEMEAGLALDYERVGELKRLTKLLKEQLYTKGDEEAGENPYPNLWVADVKQIGGGEFAERVDLVRFNSALVEQFRAALDDLAKETGGRRQKHEVTGKDGGPVEYREVTELTDDELARIAAGGSAGVAQAPAEP